MGYPERQHQVPNCYHSICPYVLVSGVVGLLPALSSSMGEVSSDSHMAVAQPFGCCSILTNSCKVRWQITAEAEIITIEGVSVTSLSSDLHRGAATDPVAWTHCSYTLKWS